MEREGKREIDRDGERTDGGETMVTKGLNKYAVGVRE